MKSTLSGAALILLHLFFAGICSGGVIPAPHIILTDSTCICQTPSLRIFDCKAVLKAAGIEPSLLPPSRRQSAGVRASALVHVLDSAGFTSAHGDRSVQGMVTIFPGKRSRIVDEVISVRYAQKEDTVRFPDAGLFPRLFDAAYLTMRQHEIAGAFMNGGYPFVKVTTEIEKQDTAESLVVTYQVSTDSVYHFAEPQMSGTFVTRLPVLLHDVTMRPGVPFSVAASRQTAARLTSRSYISDVSIGLPEIIRSTAGYAPDSARIVMPIKITDRSGMGLDGALGFDTRGSERPELYGTLEFALMNLFHSAESAELSYAGDEKRQKFDASLSVPWLFKMPLIVSGGGGLEIEKELFGYLYSNLGLFYELGIRWLAGFSGTTSTTTENSGAGSGTGSFTGFDLSLVRSAEPLRDGEISRRFSLATGSGISKKATGFSRSHLDMTISGHIPTLMHQAAYATLFTGHMVTREATMIPSEMYRVGGNRTMRGYNEDEFAFRTVIYSQFEYLFYFQKSAAWYFLCDGGAGFLNGIDATQRATILLGYGAGVRLPVTLGTLSVEWARNRSDHRSTGRIHVRLQNSISEAAGNSSFSKRNR